MSDGGTVVYRQESVTTSRLTWFDRSGRRTGTLGEPALYGQVFTTAAGLKVGAFALGAGLGGPVATGLGSAEALVVAAAFSSRAPQSA